jgi:hypothetical protein
VPPFNTGPDADGLPPFINESVPDPDGLPPLKIVPGFDGRPPSKISLGGGKVLNGRLQHPTRINPSTGR